MGKRYLQVTFQEGRPFAAYYRLADASRTPSARCRRVEPGLVIDFAADGRALGIEITAPSLVTVQDVNRVLDELGLPGATEEELAPLHAA